MSIQSEKDPRFDPSGPAFLGADDYGRTDYSQLIEETTLAERILRLEVLAKNGEPEALSQVYSAMYRQGLITPRELELKTTTANSVNLAAASVLALGDAIATLVEKGEPSNIELIERLERGVYGPAFRPYVLKALFGAYLAKARLGREPDWEFIRKLLYRWKSKSAFDAVRDGITAVALAWRRKGHEIPTGFLNGLLNEEVDPEIKAVGQSFVGGVTSLAPNEVGQLKSGEAPYTLTDQEVVERVSHDLRPLVSLLERGFFGQRMRAFKELAEIYAARIEARQLTKTEWREAIWQKDVRRYGFLYGPDLERWYRRTLEPTLFATNAQLGSYLQQRYRMTVAFNQFLRSEQFLNSPIRNALSGYGNNPGAPYSQPVLALANEILHQGSDVLNILFVTAFKDMSWPKAMLFEEISRHPKVNAILMNGDIDNIQVRESGGLAALVLKNGEWFQIYFDENSALKFHYVAARDFFYSDEYRTKSAVLADPALPELSALGIPHTDFSPYFENKDLTEGLLKAHHVPVPETLSFWTANEPLSNAARRDRQNLRASICMDGMSFEEILNVVRHFMATNDILNLVVKPSDGIQGSEISMIRGHARDGLPGRIAEKLLEFRAQGRSAVIQRKIRSLLYREKGQQNDWNVRVWLAPDKNSRMTVCGHVVRLGHPWEPVNLSRGAAAMTLDEMISHLGEQYPDFKSELETLEERIEKISIAASRVVVDAIRKDSSVESEEDIVSFMSTDVMIEQQGNRLIPKIIEMNGVNSGGWVLCASICLNWARIILSIANITVATFLSKHLPERSFARH